MTVALSDVLIWRNILREKLPDVRDKEAVLQCLKKFHWQRKQNHSFVVNVLAQALYQLFSAADGMYICLYTCIAISNYLGLHQIYILM